MFTTGFALLFIFLVGKSGGVEVGIGAEVGGPSPSNKAKSKGRQRQKKSANGAYPHQTPAVKRNLITTRDLEKAEARSATAAAAFNPTVPSAPAAAMTSTLVGNSTSPEVAAHKQKPIWPSRQMKESFAARARASGALARARNAEGPMASNASNGAINSASARPQPAPLPTALATPNASLKVLSAPISAAASSKAPQLAAPSAPPFAESPAATAAEWHMFAALSPAEQEVRKMHRSGSSDERLKEQERQEKLRQVQEIDGNWHRPANRHKLRDALAQLPPAAVAEAAPQLDSARPLAKSRAAPAAEDLRETEFQEKHRQRLERTAAREQAATMVQAAARGRTVRRKAEMLRVEEERKAAQAAVRMQAAVRGLNGRRKAKELRQLDKAHKAATTVQAAARGRAGRRKAVELRLERKELREAEELRRLQKESEATEAMLKAELNLREGSEDEPSKGKRGTMNHQRTFEAALKEEPPVLPDFDLNDDDELETSAPKRTKRKISERLKEELKEGLPDVAPLSDEPEEGMPSRQRTPLSVPPDKSPATPLLALTHEEPSPAAAASPPQARALLAPGANGPPLALQEDELARRIIADELAQRVRAAGEARLKTQQATPLLALTHKELSPAAAASPPQEAGALLAPGANGPPLSLQDSELARRVHADELARRVRAAAEARLETQQAAAQHRQLVNKPGTAANQTATGQTLGATAWLSAHSRTPKAPAANEGVLDEPAKPALPDDDEARTLLSHHEAQGAQPERRLEQDEVAARIRADQEARAQLEQQKEEEWVAARMRADQDSAATHLQRIVRARQARHQPTKEAEAEGAKNRLQKQALQIIGSLRNPQKGISNIAFKRWLRKDLPDANNLMKLSGYKNLSLLLKAMSDSVEIHYTKGEDNKSYFLIFPAGARQSKTQDKEDIAHDQLDTRTEAMEALPEGKEGGKEEQSAGEEISEAESGREPTDEDKNDDPWADPTLKEADATLQRFSANLKKATDRMSELHEHVTLGLKTYQEALRHLGGNAGRLQDEMKTMLKEEGIALQLRNAARIAPFAELDDLIAKHHEELAREDAKHSKEPAREDNHKKRWGHVNRSHSWPVVHRRKS